MPGAVEAYLAALPADQRDALTALRRLIRKHLPDCTECLSCAMPGIRHPGGKMVAGYAAFARHLGLYPHSGSVIPMILHECIGLKTSKSGVLFTPCKPLPDALVRCILDTRLAEIGAGHGDKT